MADTQDVEMKDSKEEIQGPMVVDDLKQGFEYLEKGVSNFDPRFTLKVLRNLPAMRKRVDSESLADIVQTTYPDGDGSKQQLLKYIGQKPSSEDSAPESILPEVDIYIHLLVLVWLMNTSSVDKFKNFAEVSVDKLRTYNRRSLDYLAAKVWFYYARAYELTNSLEEIHPLLLAALRSATLRHDAETQASLITLLLRTYLLTHRVSQAANLVAKTNFPESASNSLGARYMYYLAKIHAVQLNYSMAHERVVAAIRKAPQTPLSTGFLQQAHKLSVVVELLMGDIPERSVFKQPEFEKSLRPYFDVASAVRLGDISQFTQVLAKHAQTLKDDGTYSLVLRLRQNVIKTGIRIMSLTYSKISLKDICMRLHLDSEESAEYVVAKAIRDGVIDATIDHEHGYMQSKEVLDIYSSTEPQQTFHERIKFCISLHDDSVKSMRYQMNTHRADFEDMEKALERAAGDFEEGLDDLDDFDM